MLFYVKGFVYNIQIIYSYIKVWDKIILSVSYYTIVEYVR